MLAQTLRDRVLYVHQPAPALPGDGLDALAWEMLDLCEALQHSDSPPLAVALTGDGPAFWVSPPGGAADLDSLGSAWADAVAALAALAPPVVAAVGGDAIGPALDLALACDLRILAAEVVVGCPEAALGRLPTPGGIQRLARAIGGPAALRLLLLGERLPAAEALRLGLAHRAAPAAALGDALEAVLDDLRRAAPVALTFVKEAVSRAPSLPLAAGLRLEADLAALLMTTADRAEGIAAFQERRTPRYEGR